MFNLIVNNGSASKKYSIYEDSKLLFCADYERVGDSFVKNERGGSQDEQNNEVQIDVELFNNALSDFVSSAIAKGCISSEKDIKKIALRVVAPGNFFQKHKKIDQKFLEFLDEKLQMSPLHIAPVQAEISNIMDLFSDSEIYAISDSAFHRSKPDYANIYAYPRDITKKLELYRFGYHGLSVSSVVNKLKKQYSLPEKLIVCHLGGGSSVTAVKNGRSVDNTMGYSPLEGVPMATRIGNADPNSLFAVMNEKDFDIDEIQNFLYKECGLKGVSGLSSDTRIILREDKEGNVFAKLALDYYSYEIKKVIGAYKTILGGVDAIVFTGTIGVRSSDVRKRILDGLESEGIIFDVSKNKLMIKNEGNIKSSKSKVDIWVLQTDEMAEMNRILASI